MLDFTLNYSKNSEKGESHVKIDLEESIKSPIFRIEGRNGSGKTLILETLAMAFNLDPKDIQDGSLKSKYSDFVEGELEQKLEFKIKYSANEINYEATKKSNEPLPTYFLKGKIKPRDFISNNYYTFFDSIKSPEQQSEEYLRYANEIISGIQIKIDKLFAYVEQIRRENVEYESSETQYETQQKEEKEALKRYTEIKGVLTELGENKFIFETAYKRASLVELLTEITELSGQKKVLDEKIAKIKFTERDKVYNAKTTKRELEEYNRILQEIQINELIGRHRKELQILFDLKGYTTKKQLEIASKQIESIILKYTTAIARLETSTSFKDAKFYEELVKFITTNILKFKEKYPSFLEDVQKTYQATNKLNLEYKESQDLISLLLKINESIRKLIRHLEIKQTSDIDFEENNDELKERLANLVFEISSKNTKMNELRSSLPIKYTEKQRKEIEKLEKLSNDDLASKLEEIYKEIAKNQLEFETQRKRKDIANTMLERYRKMEKPKYFQDRIKITKLCSSLGKTTTQLSIVFEAMRKLKDREKLDGDEEKIIDNLGEYFASLQGSIVFGSSTKKIKKIDFQRQAYILNDGSLAPFKTNTGDVLINTLLGRLKSLPTDKKCVLLIDEITPLDPQNYETLERQIEELIKSDKVLFAALSVPGKRYEDYRPHIIEV